jgi:alpha-galactosidase
LNAKYRKQLEVNEENGALLVSRLCGLRIARNWGDEAPFMASLIRLRIAGVSGSAGLEQEALEQGEGMVRCRWRVAGTGLRVESLWQEDADTGVLSRRDTVTNNGDQPHALLACRATVTFPKGLYECYAQASSWCAENQGAWQDLHTGISLTHSSGATTQGATPYLAIRRKDTREGMAFHILPRGNWSIRAKAQPSMERPRLAVIDLGLSDEDLHREIVPGETFELPEILIQGLPDGEPQTAAPALHRHLVKNHFADCKPELPVIYNTWLDQFEVLDVDRLHRQLAAAREVGCEVFVVDAGWFGAGEGNWYEQVGDWREKKNAAFDGRMKDFADAVRAAGLGFGLWMESERVCLKAPLRKEHPEWFAPGEGDTRLDLTLPEARAWLRAEIGRLVETYGVVWMKVDFNFGLGIDEKGSEQADYAREWHALMDEVRAAYPQTVFEGCASGGMRSDIETMRHFDQHFVSDTSNPIDMLRISQGAWLRLPPGQIGRWLVLRNGGQVAPLYGNPIEKADPVLLTTTSAHWDVVGVEMDLAIAATLPGMFGLSGDPHSLSPNQRKQLAEGIAFYKKWRRMIRRSVAHLLTPPEPIDHREGWIGVQLQDNESDTSLVYTYKLGLAGGPPSLRLQGLDPERLYSVRSSFDEKPIASSTGSELMHSGVGDLLLPLQQGSVLVIERKE